MKLIVSAFFLFCMLISPVYAENQLDKYTFNYVTQIPARYEKNLFTLTSYLTRPYKNDYDKAKAIAYYIASHMVYDEYLYNEKGRTNLQWRAQRPEDFLQTKVGICIDFAHLFDKMCKQAGISSKVVEGYVMDAKKIISKPTRKDSSHAWNYFIYRSKKIYVDTTFMATATTGHEKYVTEWNRKQALYKIGKQNRIVSQTYSINAFYFDFNFAKEKETGQVHVEKIVK